MRVARDFPTDFQGQLPVCALFNIIFAPPCVPPAYADCCQLQHFGRPII